ncbi:MAG: hypothetical protein Q7S37_02735 [bacterium]|nr:hypothetical protein [bacterium]
MIRYILSFWTPFDLDTMCVWVGTIMAVIIIVGATCPSLSGPEAPQTGTLGYVVSGLATLSMFGLGITLRTGDRARASTHPAC